jgi:hypothetical protein
MGPWTGWGRGRSREAPGRGGPRGRHRRRDAPRLFPVPDRRGGRGLRVTFQGRLPLGHLARRRGGRRQTRRPARESGRLRQVGPQTATLGRGVRLFEGSYLADPQSDVAEPEPLRQLLVAGSLQEAHSTFGGFLDEVAEVLLEEVVELVRLGATSSGFTSAGVTRGAAGSPPSACSSTTTTSAREASNL